jgi:hypothetical protein
MKKIAFVSSLLILVLSLQAQIRNPKLTPVSKKDTVQQASLLTKAPNTVAVKEAKASTPPTTTPPPATTPPPTPPPASTPPASTPPPPPAFVPSPQLVQSFNWWKAISPTEFGIDYVNPPTAQSFYDNAIKNYNQKTSISFYGLPFSPGMTRLHPDSLFHLMALPSLSAVTISFATCNNTSLQQISRLPNLKSVFLPLQEVTSLPFSFSFDVTNQTVMTLLQNRNLEYLQLAQCKLVTDAAFASLKNQTSLKKLTLGNMDGLTDQFFLSLEGCTSLQEIGFYPNGNITMAGLNNLKSIMHTLPALRVIRFRGGTVQRLDFFAFITACQNAGFNVGGIW